MRIGVVVLAGVWVCGPARADGDPASDILVSESLFLPQDAGLPSGQQAQLASLVAAAQRSGYPIRVALVASRADLGSVGALWRRPQSYAQFLGQELSLVYRGPVLVIMPNGFGLYRASAASDRDRAALERVQAPGTRTRMGTSALDAIRQLAAASGHPLPLPRASVASRSGSSNAIEWAVLAIGGVMIVVAWVVSLRVRPLHLWRQTSG